MNRNLITKSATLGLAEHYDDCGQPGIHWHQPVRPGLPILGVCAGCGAIQKQAPDPEPRPHRNRELR